MLDERRKAYLRSINISSIRPNGVLWIFGEQIKTIQLSKEDIRYLRWYHNNPNIANQIDVRVERKNYKIASDANKYNNRCHTKKRVNNNGIRNKIIVGALVVGVVLGSSFVAKHTNAETVDPTAVEVTVPSEDTLVEIANRDAEYSRLETIKHLCDIYQVDFSRTYDKLKTLTGNFTSPDYLGGYIAGVTCKGTDVHASNEEELLTYAIRAIKQIPERFGLDSSICVNNGYSSGDDYAAQISDVCEVLGINRNLMYAIVQSECGFNSEMFNTINNPAGLRGVNGIDPWWVFANKEEGFLEFGMELLKYYRTIGIDPSNIDAETIRKIGDIHAPLSDGNANWLPNVLENLEYALNNEYSLFGGEEVHGLGR